MTNAEIIEGLNQVTELLDEPAAPIDWQNYYNFDGAAALRVTLSGSGMQSPGQGALSSNSLPTSDGLSRAKDLVQTAVHHLKANNYCGWIASVIWDAAHLVEPVARRHQKAELADKLRSVMEYTSMRALNS